MALSPPPGFPRPVIRYGSCTHTQVTRLYDPKAICDVCLQPGPIGWIFHCTQDMEDLIEHFVIKEELDVFDGLGDRLSSLLRVRAGSPRAREDKLSFFGEVTKDELAQYRPDQIATILRQRDEVQVAAYQDSFHQNPMAVLRQVNGDFGLSGSGQASTKPWIPVLDQQCKYKVCPICRQTMSERAFLSLDAVVEGDVPPTAAIGWGFHVKGERPVADAEIIKHIGLRNKPTPQRSQVTPESSFDSGLSVNQFLHHHLAKETRKSSQDSTGEKPPQPLLLNSPLAAHLKPRTRGHCRGELRHSPGFADLNAVADSCTTSESTPGLSGPSSSPATSVYDVRSCVSSGLNGGNSNIETASKQPSTTPDTRILTAERRGRAEAFVRNQSEQASRTSLNGEYILSNTRASDISSYFYSATALPLRLKREHGESRTPDGSPPRTPRRHPDATGTFNSTEPHDEGSDDVHFRPSPLKLEEGIAVTEESVALGVPDIITQV